MIEWWTYVTITYYPHDYENSNTCNGKRPTDECLNLVAIVLYLSLRTIILVVAHGGATVRPGGAAERIMNTVSRMIILIIKYTVTNMPLTYHAQIGPRPCMGDYRACTIYGQKRAFSTTFLKNFDLFRLFWILFDYFLKADLDKNRKIC